MADQDDVIDRMRKAFYAAPGDAYFRVEDPMQAAARVLLEDILRDAKACCEAGLGEFAVEQRNLWAYALSKGIDLKATASGASLCSPGAETAQGAGTGPDGGTAT